jgi:hypothetical protein
LAVTTILRELFNAVPNSVTRKLGNEVYNISSNSKICRKKRKESACRPENIRLVDFRLKSQNLLTQYFFGNQVKQYLYLIFKDFREKNLINSVYQLYRNAPWRREPKHVKQIDIAREVLIFRNICKSSMAKKVKKLLPSP